MDIDPIVFNNLSRAAAEGTWYSEASKRNFDRPMLKRALGIGRVTMEEVMLEEAYEAKERYEKFREVAAMFIPPKGQAYVWDDHGTRHTAEITEMEG